MGLRPLSGSPRIGGWGAVATRRFSSTKRVDRRSMNTDTKIHPPQAPRKRREVTPSLLAGRVGEASLVFSFFWANAVREMNTMTRTLTTVLGMENHDIN